MSRLILFNFRNNINTIQDVENCEEWLSVRLAKFKGERENLWRQYNKTNLSEDDLVAGDIKLNLEGRFAYAEVYVNDQYTGKFMFAHQKDISSYVKAGENKVSVVMCNSARNLLGPHHQTCGEAYVVSPTSFTGETFWTEDGCGGFMNEYAFMPFGVTVNVIKGDK